MSWGWVLCKRFECHGYWPMAFRSGERISFCRSGVIVVRPLHFLETLFETASIALLLSSLNEWLLLSVSVPSFKAMEVLLKMGDRSGAWQQTTQAIFKGSPGYHWPEDIRPSAYSFYSQHRQRDDSARLLTWREFLGRRVYAIPHGHKRRPFHLSLLKGNIVVPVPWQIGEQIWYWKTTQRDMFYFINLIWCICNNWLNLLLLLLSRPQATRHLIDNCIKYRMCLCRHIRLCGRNWPYEDSFSCGQLHPQGLFTWWDLALGVSTAMHLERLKCKGSRLFVALVLLSLSSEPYELPLKGYAASG